MTKSQKQIGAQMERNSIRRKIQCDKQEPTVNYFAMLYIDTLLDWISERHKRYNKRKGGLGK